MTTIRFSKMHGAGNDYIYVDTTRYPIEHPAKAAIAWSAPHTGIGSDGLVLIGKSDVADFSMRIFNADGSEARMCGNASRCIGKYVYDYKLTGKTEISLETLSGIKNLKLNLVDNKVDTVTVDMGAPCDIHPVRLDERYGYTEGTAVSMGNPHLVFFVDDVSKVNLEQVGPLLEHHPLFPDRTNVEFAQILPDNTIRMRVWERGSGITQACGTGACATAVAAANTGRCGNRSTVIMDGGTLQIAWNDADGHIYMTGPAVHVFDGEIDLTKDNIE